MWGFNGRSEIFPSAVCQTPSPPQTLNRALRNGVNLLVSRDGETFGFASLMPDIAKALASLKRKKKK